MPTSCKQKTEVWSPNIKVGNTYTQYNVKLERYFACCGQEKKHLFINDREVYDHGLSTDCRSGQLCAPPSHYEWTEHGHSFLLVFNSLSCAFAKDHRLFVDGIDVETGHEFSKFWRCRARTFMFCGAVLLLICVGGILLTVFKGLSFLWIPLNVVYWGLLLFITGAVVIYKVKKQTLIPNRRSGIGHKHSGEFSV